MLKNSKSLQIAQYIYNKGYTDNIQLNKLLYISFGFYGAKHKEYLFDDVIQAWRYGPVVPVVYSAYKTDYFLLGKQASDIPVELPEKEKEVLKNVLDLYGEKAPFLLVKLTHQENTPWSNAYVEGAREIEIQKEDIIGYYTDFLGKAEKIVDAIATESFKKVMRNLATT